MSIFWRIFGLVFAKQWNMRLYFYTEGKSNSVPSFRENFAVFNAILSTIEAIKCVRLEMYTNTVHVATRWLFFWNQCHWFVHDTWCVHFRRHQLEQNGDVSGNGISYFCRFNRKVPNGKQRVKRKFEERDCFGGACGSRRDWFQTECECDPLTTSTLSCFAWKKVMSDSPERVNFSFRQIALHDRLIVQRAMDNTANKGNIASRWGELNSRSVLTVVQVFKWI